MIVSEKDIQLDLPRYVDMAANGDITITRDGHEVATLTRAYRSTDAASPSKHSDKESYFGQLDSIIGILPSDASLEAAREERLSKI